MTPDSLVLWWAELREIRGTPPAWNPIGLSDERCARCRLGMQTTIVWKVTERASFTKDVCGTCWAANVDRYGLESAGRVTPIWESIQRTDARGAVKVAARRGASENRLAAQTDVWLAISGRVETLPPSVCDLAWRLGRSGLVYYQHDRVGTLSGARAIGEEREPDLPWGVLDLREAIETVRWWLQRRIRRARWKREEVAMGGEFLSPAEVAAVLGVNERTVRRWIDQGYLEAVPLHPEGAKQPRWGVPRGELERVQKRRAKSTSRQAGQTGRSGHNAA